MAKTFAKRTKSNQRNSATTSGFMNDFVHLSGSQTNYQVTDGGGYVLVRIVFNTAPSADVVLKVGSDELATLNKAVAVGSLNFGVYLDDKLYYSGDADVTFVISKG